MMTIWKFNPLSIEHPKDKTLLLYFLDELRFDDENTGSKSNRDKSLVKLDNSPASRASSFKKSNPNRGST